jgi:hypothetical protein
LLPGTFADLHTDCLAEFQRLGSRVETKEKDGTTYLVGAVVETERMPLEPALDTGLLLA